MEGAPRVFVVFGVMDLFRQQRRFMKDMRMSKQEVQRRSQGTEGNPEVKRQDPAIAPGPGPPPHDEGSPHRDRGDRQSHALRGGASVTGTTPWRRRWWWRRARIISRCGSADRDRESACRWWKIRRWRRRCTNRWMWAAKFPPHLYRAVAEVLAYIYRLTNVRRQWNLRGAGTVPR